jgi:hypothetical protein
VGSFSLCVPSEALYASPCYSGATAAVASLLHEMRHPWVVTDREGAPSVLVHWEKA